MKLEKTAWGITKNGEQASKYTMTNDNGMVVVVGDFTGSFLDICVPVNGQLRSVVLGYENFEDYYRMGPEFAGLISRNGNRIANGQVTLDGVTYQLEQNNFAHNLHSGSRRSYHEFYEAATGEEADAVWVELSRTSADMEQGFPGNLDQKIRYTLTDKNELILSYHMVSDKETVINPTNHSYFNLNGHNSGDVLEQTLQIHAETFLPTDDTLIPTGEERAVEGTPLDFRSPKKIGANIDDDYEPLRQGRGIDHNFCFANDGKLKEVAVMQSTDKAVTMHVSTDLCGMQVYAGNFLNGIPGKEGAVYNKRNGICLETQYYPNACNEPSFASSVKKAGEAYDSKTVLQFDFAS